MQGTIIVANDILTKKGVSMCKYLPKVLFGLVLIIISPVKAQNFIIDHNCTTLSEIPLEWIDSAKSKLHIAYGHTSHGSQITEGMLGLVEFANGGGKGLSFPEDMFAWNNGGENGALDLHDYAMGGDVGYYPDWVNNTREYLDDTTNSDVNVIMWSWCGQVSGKYENGTLFSQYIQPMTQLEEDYPDVRFIYMTGHLDHWDDANNKAANDSIRSYCRNNGKILFDFADIESYNPDGVFFEYAHDNCDYYNSEGEKLGNWAEEWREAHTENVDWYYCGAQHSDVLNANQKAYAAWWMWARLAGWQPVTGVSELEQKAEDFNLSQNYPNPFNPSTLISYQLPMNSNVALKIYDILGREVKTLINEQKPAGVYTVQWNGINSSGNQVGSGIYFYQLKTGSGLVETKKMMIIK